MLCNYNINETKNYLSKTTFINKTYYFQISCLQNYYKNTSAIHVEEPSSLSPG